MTNKELAQLLLRAKSEGNTEMQERIAQEIVSRSREARKEAKAPAEDFDAMKMIANIPGSAAQYGVDMATAAMNPIDTGTAIAQTAGGALSKVPLIGETFPSLAQYEPMADSFGEMISAKHGTPQKRRAALTNDPIGMLADLSIVGAVPKISRTASLSLNPLNAAANITKKGVQKAIPEDYASKAYQSATKLDTVTDPRSAERMTRAALENQILPTTGGLNIAKERINEIGNEIRAKVSEVEGSVPREAIYGNIGDVRKEVGGTSIEAPRDLRIVDKYVKDYNEYLKSQGIDTLNASQLQEMKQSVWGEIYSDRVKQKTFRAKDLTREAIGRKAASLVEELAPGVKPLNQKQGDLLELMKQLPKKSQRIANRNAIPLAGGGNTLTGYVLGEMMGVPMLGTALGVGLSWADMPIPKAKRALAAHQLKNKPNVMTSNNMTPAMIREMYATMQEHERQQGLLD